MENNKLKSTIDSLDSFGQVQAIKDIAHNLKDAYEYAMEIIAKYSNGETFDRDQFKKETDDVTERTYSKPSALNKYADYDSKWPLAKKYQYILKMENRFMHFREVARIIIAFENLNDDFENEKAIARAIGNSVRDLKVEKKIIKKYHQGKIKNCFWGSPKWLDDNGEIKKEHHYRTEILKLKTQHQDKDELFEI